MITQTYATETAEELYQKGVLLSEQWQPAADKYIKKAADLGNTKAMCLWAEMNKPSMFIHTEESIKYYLITIEPQPVLITDLASRACEYNLSITDPPSFPNQIFG